MAAMLVETFEVPEVDHEGTPECEAEALELIEKLGLKGQKKLLQPKTNGGLERTPYRKMTKYEAFVYKTLCPTETELEKYADGPIPLRVLQVAAHARDLFKSVVVWHPTSADVKDPVLVGTRTRDGYITEYFMLARWGTELEAFSVLANKASVMFREKFKAAASKILANAKSALARIDDVSGEDLAEESIPYANYLT